MSAASRRDEAQDPATSPERLAQLAAKHRDLWPLIAVHPAADAEVLGWMAQRGDDELRAAITARGDAPAGDAEPAGAAEPAPRRFGHDVPVGEIAAVEAAGEDDLVEDAPADRSAAPRPAAPDSDRPARFGRHVPVGEMASVEAAAEDELAEDERPIETSLRFGHDVPVGEIAGAEAAGEDDPEDRTTEHPATPPRDDDDDGPARLGRHVPVGEIATAEAAAEDDPDDERADRVAGEELPRDRTEPDSWHHEIGVTRREETARRRRPRLFPRLIGGLIVATALVAGIVLLAVSGDDDGDDEAAATPTAAATEEPDAGATSGDDLTSADFCAAAQDVSAAEDEIMQFAATEDSVALADVTDELRALATDYEALAALAPAEVRDAVTTVGAFFAAVADRPAGDTGIPDTTGLIASSQALVDYAATSCTA